jgi:hypothetical protein
MPPFQNFDKAGAVWLAEWCNETRDDGRHPCARRLDPDGAASAVMPHRNESNPWFQ